MVLDAGGPAWNLENNTIVFFSGVEGGLGQLWTIAKDGKKRMQLTFPPKPPANTPFPYTSNDDPQWSPDGKKVMFSTLYTITDQGLRPGPLLCILDLRTSDQNCIADIAVGAFLPGRGAWQPVP